MLMAESYVCMAGGKKLFDRTEYFDIDDSESLTLADCYSSAVISSVLKL